MAAGLTACALFTPIEGYSDGPPAGDDSGADTSIDSRLDEAEIGVDASEAGNASDAGFDGPSFFDDFARADSPVIGNDWVEKTPDVFGLLGGAAVKSEAGAGSAQYHNALVYRPQAEDRADVEATAILTIGAGIQNPQIFVRAQRSTIATVGAYEAYILFLSPNSQVTLARQRGAFGEMGLTSASVPALVAGQRIRLTLRATGEMPVALAAFVDRLEAGTETRIAQVTFSDDSVDRLSTPGSTGFTASHDTIVTVDDFAWRALGTK